MYILVNSLVYNFGLFRDLSYNKLQYIEKNNLENLRKLRKLHLNNNRLSFIEEGSFNNTPMIRTL